MDASEEKAEERARILVVGGGFGGLFTALDLTGAGEVTLVADEDHFLHTPLLYEYLSGEVEAWHIAPRYTELIDDDKVRFVHGAVTDVDFDQKEVAVAGRVRRCLRLPRARRRRRDELLGRRGRGRAHAPLQKIRHADDLRARMIEALDPSSPTPRRRTRGARRPSSSSAAALRASSFRRRWQTFCATHSGGAACAASRASSSSRWAGQAVPGMGEDMRAVVEEAMEEKRVEIFTETRVVRVMRRRRRDRARGRAPDDRGRGRRLDCGRESQPARRTARR